MNGLSPEAFFALLGMFNGRPAVPPPEQNPALKGAGRMGSRAFKLSLKVGKATKRREAYRNLRKLHDHLREIGSEAYDKLLPSGHGSNIEFAQYLERCFKATRELTAEAVGSGSNLGRAARLLTMMSERIKLLDADKLPTPVIDDIFFDWTTLVRDFVLKKDSAEPRSLEALDEELARITPVPTDE
jgi:hypothetical protein